MLVVTVTIREHTKNVECGRSTLPGATVRVPSISD